MLYETKLLPNINVCVSLPDLVWGVLSNGEFQALDSVSRCSTLLPLLEKDYEKVKKRIDGICNELEIQTVSFPYNFLLVHALKYPTSYWPNLAVIWLKSSGIENTEILNCLAEIENNKCYEQKLRQRCKALLRKTSKGVRS